MKMSPTIIYFFVIATVLTDCNAYLSEAAIKQTQAMLRNVCSKKYPVEQNVLNNIKIGEIPEDNDNLKCYIGCKFKTMQLVSPNGIIEKKQVKDKLAMLAPPSILSIILPSIEECGEKDKESICQTTFNFLKCSYGVDPKTMEFFL